KFDLTIFLWDAAAGLKGSVEYNTDLFDAPTITRMLGHLERVLQAVSLEPDLRIKNVPLLSEAERRQLLVEWSGEARTVDYGRPDPPCELRSHCPPRGGGQWAPASPTAPAAPAAPASATSAT